MASADGKANRLKTTPLQTPSCLQAGLHFRRWDEEDGEGPFAHHEVKVDCTGLVLSILSDINEGVPIYMSEVSDVRCGKYARHPKDQKLIHSLSSTAGVASFEDIAVTIVYGTNMVDVNYLNLAAISNGDVSLFVDSVRSLLNNVVGYNVSEEIMLWREYARISTLRNPAKDGISVRHLHAMFALRQKDDFQQAMSSRGWSACPKDFVPSSEFDLQSFCQLYDDLVPTAYTADVIKHMGGEAAAAAPTPHVSVKEFCKFLNESHRDPQLNEVLFKYLKEEEVQQYVDAMEPQREFAEGRQITAEGLRNFLRSKENAIIHLSRFAVHQNMEQPLCHYFVNSSHNTYLTGHQLTGKATVEIYRQVLLTGCRCIELDCWDGGDGEPIVTHGNTLVNNIPFKDVVEAINECAFRVSEYPILLSFENHCRFRQQRRMVQHLRNILGEKLMEPLLDYPIVPGTSLPSPSQLRGKIVCKNKLLVPKLERGKDDDGNSVAGDGGGRRQSRPTIAEDDVVHHGHRAPFKCQSYEHTPVVEMERLSTERRCSEDAARQLVLTLPSDHVLTGADGTLDAGAPSLCAASWCELDMASLVNYLEPVKFKSFEESEARNKHYQMSSFAETQAIRLVLDTSVDFVKYTRRQNTRIYPRGTRVDSSNYQPQVFWNVGCQMVSLNFQTLDLPMQLNLGKFDYNGMCGYLLKPEVMRRPDRDFDPFAESPIDNVVASTVTVTVIAAHMVTAAKETIRVDVDMYGIPADTVRRKFKTKCVQNDTTVYFRSQPFVFKKVVLADHAMMRFAAIDSQGILLGMRVLPLDGLEPGYRYIHLHNDNNQPLPLASLFVFVQLSEYIPKEMHDFAMGLTNPVQYQKERHQQALCNMMDEDPLLTEATAATAAAAAPGNAQARRFTAAAAEQQQVMLTPGAPGSVDSMRPRMASSFSAGSGAGSGASSGVSHSGVSHSLSRARKSIYSGKASGSAQHCTRDIIGGRDAQKMLGRINKEISATRKKFLKMQASINKTHASELKKNAARGGDEQRIKDKHSAEMSKLVQRCLGDEETLLLKQLPAFFAWVTKVLTGGHAADMRRLEMKHKKNLSVLISANQKENAQLSHQYKEDQKRMDPDKEELQRKIREYSNKLVEMAVEVRSDTLRKQGHELEVMELSQQEDLLNLQLGEEAELERVRKLYASRVRLLSSSEGVQEYMSLALADPAFAPKAAVEIP